MPDRLLTMAANAMWIAVCRAEHRRFQMALPQPRRVQEEILWRLLRENAPSAYGQTMSFNRLRTVGEFQRAVPVVTADDLAPWVERIKRGETGVLTREPVVMFEKSSGSAAAAKYIPYTRSLRREFQAAIRTWMFDLYSSRPTLFGGRSYWAITPVSRTREVTAGNVPVGFDDDSQYLGTLEQYLLRRILAVPASVARTPALEEALYTTLLHLLASPDLRFISVWNPSFLQVLVSRMERHSERLVRDLHRKHRRRCRLVEKVIAGTEPLRACWPRLDTISCWADADARWTLPWVRETFPGVMIQGKGLLATEGVLSIPLVRAGGCALAVTSHFLEFIPVDGGAPRLADEMECGGEYSVLLTTGGGLWRYRLGDMVRVTGFIQGTPLVEFLGREDGVSDLRGEKLSPAFVSRTLIELESRSLWRGSFAMLAPVQGEPPGYALFLHGRVSAGLDEALEHLLCENPHYAYCRRLRQLGAVRVFQISEDPAGVYLKRCEELGLRLGNIKPAALHRSFDWERYFRGAFVTRPTVECSA